MANVNLTKARGAKNDEFYTQLSDIEKELKHYKGQFRNKTVYCNCDDPYESNFFKYFASNFDIFGLKGLIATSYTGSPIAGKELPFSFIKGLETGTKDSKGKGAIRIKIKDVKDFNNDGAVNILDTKYNLEHNKEVSGWLDGNGDFRSKECIELLKQSDIVVTNPPFSLFREYVAQLFEYQKKFLIIGSMNAITYKEIFPLIKENKMWLGVNNGPKIYEAPTSLVQGNVFVGSDGKKYAKMGNTCWFTNLPVKKRTEDIILYKTYYGHEDEYPHYDNYDAIEVSKVSNIPTDYDGVMGVPITFLDKYNPEQFEIIGGTANGQVPGYLKIGKFSAYNNPILDGKKIYQRILIKRKRK